MDVWQNLASHVSVAIPPVVDSPATDEEFTLIEIVRNVIGTLEYPIPVYTWDFVRDLKMIRYDPKDGIEFADCNIPGYSNPPKNVPAMMRLMAAIAFIGSLNGVSGLFIFLDGHQYLSKIEGEGATLARQIKILIDRFKHSGVAEDGPDSGHIRRFMFMGENVRLTDELTRLMPTISIPKSSDQEIVQEILLQAKLFEGNPEYPGYTIPESQEIWNVLLNKARTLTHRQIELAVARSANIHGSLGLGTGDYFDELKLENLHRLGLSVMPAPAWEIGGLNNLKRWLSQRIVLFNRPETAKDALNGFLVVGVPGCGKSLLAQTAGQMLNVPVISLQPDSIFGSLVGQSEQQLRQIFKALDLVSPCILFIDEIDKLITPDGNDSVGRRILGMLLNWMQEKTSQVVVIATANNVVRLPAELTRKGRFDEVFFVDLPTAAERAEIVKIHLSHYGENMPDKDKQAMVKQIVDATEGFSGADIAEAIKSAWLQAATRDELGVVALEDVIWEIKSTTPLSAQRPEAIEAMRQEAAKYRPAHVEVQSDRAEAGGSRKAARRMTTR